MIPRLKERVRTLEELKRKKGKRRRKGFRKEGAEEGEKNQVKDQVGKVIEKRKGKMQEKGYRKERVGERIKGQ